MASEAGDLPSSKHGRIDDMTRGGEKGKAVQRRGSSKSKGSKSSGAAGRSSTGTKKGNCEISFCMRCRAGARKCACVSLQMY